MSASSSHVPSSGDAGFQSVEELNDFKLLAPTVPAHALPLAHPATSPLSAISPSTPEGAERFKASIVIVLTLACTILSLLDLFLLASGS